MLRQHQNDRFHQIRQVMTPQVRNWRLCVIAFSVAFADERLRALRESVEQAHGNDGEIGSDAVSGDTDISASPRSRKLKTIAITAEDISPTKADTPSWQQAIRWRRMGARKRKSDLIVFSW